MSRLYVSDMDGTLLNSNKELTDFTKDALNSFIQKGELFSVATARTAGTVVKMLKDVNINCPVVLMNGAMIYDIKNEKYVHFEVIESAEAEKICSLVSGNDINGFLYVFNGEKLIAYYEKIDEYSDKFYNQRKDSSKYKEFKETDKFANHIEEECVYFALMDSYEKLKIVYDGLSGINVSKEMYKDIYEDDLYYLEIFGARANKKNGVLYLKEYTDAKALTVFGDNLNDLSMFEAADVKVAPENAVEKVRENADFICKNNDNDGVARYLYEQNT